MSREHMRKGIEALRAAGDTEAFADWDVDDESMPMISAESDIAVEIAADEFVDAKIKAMLAHATQITADGPFFAGAEVLGHQMWAREHYRFVAGVPFPVTEGWADDLFAGLS